MYRVFSWAIGDLLYHLRRHFANVLWGEPCVRCGRRRCSGHRRYLPPPPRAAADRLLGAGRLLLDDRPDLLAPWQDTAQQETERL